MARKATKAKAHDAELREAHEHLERGRPQKALAILMPLARRVPDRPDVVSLLVNAYHDNGDLVGYEHACRQLLELVPDHAEVALMLGGAHLHNHRPALACLAFSRFLERFPDHERAAEARDTVQRLAEPLAQYLHDLGFSGDDGLQLAALHEESNALLERGDLREARRLAERLLKRKPDCLPSLNNVSQLYWMEGMADRAVAAAQQVLSIEPDNPHALSNLARYHFLAGRPADARDVAERLKRVANEAPERWVKQAEAMAFLGDDDAVLQAYQRGRAQGSAANRAVLHHLAAVVHARRGDEEAARSLWRSALDLDPALELATQNLEDLALPRQERLGPWAMTLGAWLSDRALRDLDAVFDAMRDRGPGGARTAARQYLKKHPELTALLPHLVHRGDPVGRELAVRLAAGARSPECMAALRQFLDMGRGPADLREEARRALDA